MEKKKMARRALPSFVVILYLVGLQLIQLVPVFALDETVTWEGSSPEQEVAEPVDGVAPNPGPPIINQVEVYGDVNDQATGVGYFDSLEIEITGENLTDDHFLTPEGLHWSEQTQVELIHGAEIGIINNPALFGAQNNPMAPVKGYTMNDGDQGRITYVGKTRSGVDLDLIWTVAGSDQAEWVAHSGYISPTRVQGLAFTGEQNIPNTTGNSIVVLYNRANTLGIHYQIVAHDTMEEMPVVISFITTDIDSAQGVQTDLANLTEIIPENSGLSVTDGVIYDQTPGPSGSALNGAVDLPRGGYLGVGFLSNFDYIFYAPAPERMDDAYDFALSARYDIFGSSLQANVATRVKQWIQVNYMDMDGTPIKEMETYTGFSDKTYVFSPQTIAHYEPDHGSWNTQVPNHPVLSWYYQRRYQWTFRYLDEKGNSLRPDTTQVHLKGSLCQETPPYISGYQRPSSFETVVNQDGTHRFIYKKNPQGILTTLSPPAPFYQNPDPLGILPPKAPPLRKVALGSVRKGSSLKVRKESTDFFEQNTGIGGEDKKVLLAYLKAVEMEAKKEHPHDKGKVDHQVANALAYWNYHDDRLQTKVNDFGEKPENQYSEDASEILIDSHEEEIYSKIDFPHMGTTFASMESSGFFRDLGKEIAATNILDFINTPKWGFTNLDRFFQANSFAGDARTTMGPKDFRTDVDAFILRYHPLFRTMPLRKKIVTYYNTPHLEQQRKIYFNEAKIAMGPSKNPEVNWILLQWVTALTASAVALTLLGIRDRWVTKIKRGGRSLIRKAGNWRNGIKRIFKSPLRLKKRKKGFHPVRSWRQRKKRIEQKRKREFKKRKFKKRRVKHNGRRRIQKQGKRRRISSRGRRTLRKRKSTSSKGRRQKLRKKRNLRRRKPARRKRR